MNNEETEATRLRSLVLPEHITRAFDVEMTSKTIEALTGMTIEQVAEGFRYGKLVPKEGLPVVPKYVADWIEQVRESHSISWLLNYRNIVDHSHELTLWCFESGNDDNLHKLARAWLDGYEVEEVPKYHALIKGFELVSGYDIYWNYDKSDCSVFVSRLHPPHDNFITEMTEQEWFVIGIDDSNAHFVEVGN